MRSKRQHHDEHGIVAAEFALIFVAVFGLLVGIVEFGRYYNASIIVTSAAREGVRKVALRDAGNADSTAIAAAGGISVSPGGMVTCPATGTGTDARYTLTSSFTFDAFLPIGTKTISRTAVMRCGG